MFKNLKKIIPFCLALAIIISFSGVSNIAYANENTKIALNTEINNDYLFQKNVLLNELLDTNENYEILEKYNENGISLTVVRKIPMVEFIMAEELAFTTCLAVYEYSYSQMHLNNIFDANITLNYSFNDFSTSSDLIRNYKLNNVSGTFYNKGMNAVDNVRMTAYGNGYEIGSGGSSIYHMNETRGPVYLTLSGQLERTFSENTGFIYFRNNANGLGAVYAEITLSAHNYYGQEVLKDYTFSIIIPVLN